MFLVTNSGWHHHVGQRTQVAELVRGAEMAQKANPDIEVVLIGPEWDTDLPAFLLPMKEQHLLWSRRWRAVTWQPV